MNSLRVLPSDVGASKRMEYMDLSRNNFSGEIPSIIGEFQSLTHLDLSRSLFHGSISQSFGALITLDFLDLSCNNLSGPIPKSLKSLSHLQFLNLSFNKLSGEIPKGGSFANFTSKSFMNNEKLCGEAYLQVPPCKQEKEHTRKPTTKKTTIIVLLPIVATVMILAFLMYLVRKSKKQGINQSSFNFMPTMGQLEHKRISYLELRRVTDNFSELNLIGTGSFGCVYKGILSNGVIVAIKVLNLHHDGAFRSFDAECKVLRSVRHRNLVKIISSCSNQEFRALVLEYMPNGSLDKWLYFEGYKLGLQQRISIMIDVAMALEYLHFGQTEPIVHCDIKPGNILLDEDMTAHVTDFGIAKVLIANKDETQTRTLGTIGYIAPEYGSEGRISTKGDVYSYGIVLLETFTGRKPTDETLFGEQSLRQWVQESLPANIMEVVDRHLIAIEVEGRNTTDKQKCLLCIMELAMLCSRESPEERIDMKEVVVRLKKIKLELSHCCLDINNSEVGV